MVTLIVTAKLNDIDPQAWLADVLGRMPNLPMSRLPELLPWNWAAGREREPKPPDGSRHHLLQSRTRGNDDRREP